MLAIDPFLALGLARVFAVFIVVLVRTFDIPGSWFFLDHFFAEGALGKPFVALFAARAVAGEADESPND